MSQGSNFVDYVKICCRSGHGGAGSSHLHRDKFTATGGPDGGDGGGQLVIEGTPEEIVAAHARSHTGEVLQEFMSR